MSYVLKCFDDPVMKFELSMEFDGPVAKILWITSRRDLLPLDLELTDAGVVKWLRWRTIPSSRAYVENFLAKLSLNTKDLKGIIDMCKGLSLNDCYWIVELEFDGLFADYNLYENRFSATLATMAFTGHGDYQRSSFRSSPEFTTNGALAKCWRRSGGEVQLFKSGSEGASNAGNEPYSEFYAYQVAEAMGIHAVKYRLSRWKGRLCSTCRLFTSQDQAYIPIGRLVKDGGMRAVMEFYKGLGDESFQALADMLVFDAVVCNVDRHFGNFGVLVDTHSNQITGMAPIFDNGMALFPFAMPDDLKSIAKFAAAQRPAVYPDFMEMARSVMGRRQHNALRGLLTFEFRKHPRYNRDDFYIRAAEFAVRTRASELLQG